MPKLRLSFDLLHVDIEFLFAVDHESELGGDTEKWNCQERNLLKHAIPGELHIDLLFTVEIMNGQWRDLHNIAYVQQMQPLRLIQVSKQYFHVNLLVVKTVIRCLIARMITLWLVFGWDHFAAYLIDDGINAVGCPLKHWDLVIIVDQVLPRLLIIWLLLLLLLMHQLFLALGFLRFVVVDTSQFSEVS